MKKISANQFWESALMNNGTFNQYYSRLMELTISMFEWKNLPPTIDSRFMELILFSDGMCIFFNDEDLGFLCLRCMTGGSFNIYEIPIDRTAYGSNGYNKKLNINDSVVVYNNLIHTNSMLDVEMFAKRLYNVDRIIDVNINAQKTPVLIRCEESQRLTMKNLYKQYDGNEPVIFGDKNLSGNALQVLKTEAPFLADKLSDYKARVWNEALTYLGISNISTVKKERLITDEVIRNQGGTIASRYSRLESRRNACREINRMFGLNLWCDFREDYQGVNDEDTINGEPNSDGIGGELNE